MTDHVVVDVEIQKPIESLSNGWNSTEEMGVSIAVVWEFLNGGRFLLYGPDDVAALRDRLLAAHRISGFNIFNFDFPVIWGASRQQWNEWKTERASLIEELLPKTDDILRRIWQAKGLNPDNFVPSTHGGYKLDDVANLTLGRKKLANGAIAPVWFQEGKLYKLIEYCIEDVAIERELGLYLDFNGHVKTPSGQLEIPHWGGIETSVPTA